MKKTIIFGLLAVMFSCSTTSEKGPLSKYEKSIERYRNKIHSEHLSDEGPFRTEEERGKFIGFKYFKTSETFQIEADLTPFEEMDTIIMKTSAGKDRAYLKFGTLNFDLSEQNHNLILFKSVGKNVHYFLPFTDETSGNLSYGGGRYLDIETNEVKPKMVIDFNKAYNPYCAYVDGYSCPIPPKENHVSVKIEAGVMYQKSVFKN